MGKIIRTIMGRIKERIMKNNRKGNRKNNRKSNRAPTAEVNFPLQRRLGKTKDGIK